MEDSPFIGLFFYGQLFADIDTSPTFAYNFIDNMKNRSAMQWENILALMAFVEKLT